MKLENTDIEIIKDVLWCCRVLDIPAVVFTGGFALGMRESYDAAIVSELEDFTIPKEVKLGVGRISELEKRIAIFADQLNGDLTLNDAGDVKVIQFSSGKSKIQFRCTSTALIKYPKRNNDNEFATILMDKTEATNIVRALKTLSSEDVQLHISRDGLVKISCVDSSNDKFEIELSEQVKYHDEADSAIYKYNAGRFATLVDSIVKDGDGVALVVGGQIGSLTGKMRGHTVVIFPLSNEEEEDE